MPVLIVHHLGQSSGGVIRGAVVVGRTSGHAISIDDPDVLRKHAKIVKQGDDYFVSDLSSRTGTLINGEPLVGRRKLIDDDEIAVGPATIQFTRNQSLPPGAQRLRLFANGIFRSETSDRRQFECPCGKPIEVALPLTSALSRCAWCEQFVIIPLPAAPHSATCSVCLFALEASEEKTTCPTCGQTFHADCWIENRGCAAYGCPQVGALDATAEAPTADMDSTADVAEDIGSVGTPREALLLAASIFAALVGILTFGVPAMLVGAGTIIHMARHPTHRRSHTVMLSAALSVVGCFAGLAVSSFWWLNFSG